MATLLTSTGTQEHEVVSPKEWTAKRKELLRKEKEFTRLRDELSRQRRELPWKRWKRNMFLTLLPASRRLRTSSTARAS